MLAASACVHLVEVRRITRWEKPSRKALQVIGAGSMHVPSPWEARAVKEAPPTRTMRRCVL
eukprot:2585923-Alexandrium_andersonii.AAC.1